MQNIEAYEQNLAVRLEELRQGDQAYEMHELAISEAVVFAHEVHGYNHTPRLLDVGCGLGFLTAKLARVWPDTVGIDPSKRAIDLARKEHDGVTLFEASAQSFPEVMKNEEIELFDQAILNMVLHSVDDDTVLDILASLRECIVPEGTVLIVAPTQNWLVQKLIEYAQYQEMEREPGIAWVAEQLRKRKVELPVKIRGGEYWPEPILIYNRTLDEYGDMLRSQGYGVKLDSYHTDTGEKYNSQVLPYWSLFDYFVNYELAHRKRELLMSFALID